MQTKPNYGGLDRFRIVAALLVVAIHTSPLTSFSEGADFFVTRVLARIAVPFFFLVTGHFVAAGFLSPSRKELARFRRYLRRVLLLYLFAILLYLPIGIYAGHYKYLGIGGALRMLLFDGTFYHLWYFPACLLGILLLYLMGRALSLRAMAAISAVLYVIGLLGDSYYGLIQEIPPLEALYDGIFQISSYTRNGLFFAPLFLLLGAWIGLSERPRHSAAPQKPASRQNLLFLWLPAALCFALMTGEAFLLRHFELQRHDSMYLMLPAVMFFLYRGLLCLPLPPDRYLREAATWIYLLHPACIVAVRGISKPLRLVGLVVDNSFFHYLAVAVLSALAGFLAAEAQDELALRLSDVLSARKTPLPLRGRRKAQDKTYQDIECRELSYQEPESKDAEFQDSGYQEPDDEDSVYREPDFQNAGYTSDDDSEYHKTGFQDVEYAPDDEDVESREPGFQDAGYEPDDEDAEYHEAGFQKSKDANLESAEPDYDAIGYDASEQESESQEAEYLKSGSLEPAYRQDADTPRNLSECGQPPQEMPAGCRAWIEVDSDALAHNVAFLRSKLPQNCRLLPAVKADGYGHGALLTARELNRLGVDAFCVASASEGAQLREAGIEGEILILGYTHPDAFPLLSRWKLTQTVVDIAYAHLLNAMGQELPVHIGIDTGMHRLGIWWEDMEELRSAYRMENLRVDGLFTHLCVSDSLLPEHRAFTDSQISAFYQAVDTLKAEGFPCPGLHLLASYGILNLLQDHPPRSFQRFADRRGAERQQRLAADYVRPGIVLYGALSMQDPERWRKSLRPVLTLKARLASVRLIYAGESVGYGAAFTADRDMLIGAVSIGYADGLPRALSCGRGSVLLRGHKAPILGRICMDQTIIDVTDIPGAGQGDEVVLIGKSGNQEITVGEVAEQCGTITNEILSRLGARLERVLL